jgi:iron-sulfur cluster repair protein YtfE (RIC family)
MRDFDHTHTFVTHLRGEHRRLHELLRRIETQWSADIDDPAADQSPEVLEGLESFREELARHFTQEEQGGCLEEAVSRCPSLSLQAAEIESEHPQILERLDQILVGARRGLADRNAACKTRREFKSLAHELHAHEAAENRILVRAFGSDAEELETT